MYMQVTRGIETDDVTLVYCVPNILTRRHDAKEYKDNCNLRLDYSSQFENNVQVWEATENQPKGKKPQVLGNVTISSPCTDFIMPYFNPYFVCCVITHYEYDYFLLSNMF